MDSNLIRKYIVVEGIVQGVGFRPFIYNLSIEKGLNGWVMNTSEGVFIDIEGRKERVEIFIDEITLKAPPLSKIEKITINEKSPVHYKNFVIKKSRDNKNTITLISPDIATCQECENDIKDKNNRRYRYPFTNCTNCGPRFSIIQELPYDRDMTTMNNFKMCNKCSKEYKSPANRRFHAQPNACSECGPKVWLEDKRGEIELEDPIKEAIRLLKAGKILAVKGLGGFHLVCDGTNEAVIKKLRKRKFREYKPFAVMMKDLKTIKKYCRVNDLEANILTGIRKPILLLDKANKNLPKGLAPQNNKLGVMLPYTPLHYLLFEDKLDVLVMTSANISGMPMVYRNNDAKKELNDIVDYFLLHNRDIHMPIDDSVSRVILGKEVIIRRARGYAPIPMRIKGINDMLACGSNLKNTFCISKGELAFISQHIGDLENIETYKNYENIVKHFKSIYSIKPERIACDMHPDYLSSEYAKKQEGKLVKVQHHHAHIASCMVDNNLDEKVIGVAFDGTGLGNDNKIWGGEFLVCDFKHFKRVGHLDYVKLQGGDFSVKEPWRMAVSYLEKHSIINADCLTHLNTALCDNVRKLINKNINCIETSSMGRLFDAVSALIGVKTNITYEGEAAIALEQICDISVNSTYDYSIDNIERDLIINHKKIIKGIINDLENKLSISSIAMKFHNTVVDFTINMCKLIRSEVNVNKVALSGGVFHNEIILIGVFNGLKKEGFQVYTHGNIPCNDGGISIGQLVIASYNK